MVAGRYPDEDEQPARTQRVECGRDRVVVPGDLERDVEAVAQPGRQRLGPRPSRLHRTRRAEAMPYWSGSQNHHTSAGARANTRPTARSISPLMRSITSPAATIAIGAIDSLMFRMLSSSRKTGFFA